MIAARLRDEVAALRFRARRLVSRLRWLGCLVFHADPIYGMSDRGVVWICPDCLNSTPSAALRRAPQRKAAAPGSNPSAASPARLSS